MDNKDFRVLVLDDDRRQLDEVRLVLEREGCRVFVADNVQTAEQIISRDSAGDDDGIDFAIVDLFLAGDAGAHLSNDFIAKSLCPLGIAYGRLTSAPYAVPAEFQGLWVLDKRLFWRQPEVLVDALIETRAELAVD